MSEACYNFDQCAYIRIECHKMMISQIFKQMFISADDLWIPFGHRQSPM